MKPTLLMDEAGGEELGSGLNLSSRTGTGSRMKSGKRLRIPSVDDLANKKEEEKWTIFSASQNLSTVLNDPSNRELDLFTRTWGSYFVSTAPLPPSKFPVIEVTDFRRYLKETNAGRKIHRKINRELKKERGEPCLTPTSPGDFLPLSTQLQQDGRDYDITSVPRIFIQRDFSLEDPPTFQEVLPLAKLMPKKKNMLRSQTQPTSEKESVGGEGEKGKESLVEVVKAVPEGTRELGPEGTDRHHSFKLLHEKLTHYLDVIEVHLAYQISQRSDVFFSTLSSQQELQSYIMQVRQDVMELRHKLMQLNSSSTRYPFQLFKKCRRYQHYRIVDEKLKMIATVQQTQPTIQLLLRKSDFVGALDLITTTQEVLQQELHGVHALRHLGSQLAEMESAIEKMMESDLVEYAMEDIRHRLTHQEDNDANESEERLGLVVMGLLRQGKFHFLTALRENLISFLKAKVKGIITGYLQVEEVGEEPSSLADCMRSMDFEAWTALLAEVFERMLHCQSAVQGSLKVIGDICSVAGGLQSSGVSNGDSRATSPSECLSLPQTPDVSSASDVILSPHVSLGGSNFPSHQENGVVSSFEASSLAQEAEDRLAQLMMDDELSDARLTFEGESPAAEDNALTASSLITTSSVTTTVKTSDELNNSSDCIGENTYRSRSEVTRPREDQMVTQQHSTHDPREKERLMDISTPASVGKQPAAIISVAEAQRLLMECREVMSASCSLVHARCAKILSIRAKAGLLEDLVPTDFERLVHLIEDFVCKSAVLTGRHCPHLRVALQSQAKAFLDNFHDNRRRKLSLLLDNERWKEAEVPVEVQALVNQLASGISLPLQVEAAAGDGSSDTSTCTDSSSHLPPTKFLLIHNNNYAVVGTVLMLVKVLLEYCHYADSLPMLINEVMTKLIDLTKYFNSRTCELVLGAGAMDVVGLKAITARHLALMMRCLQAVSQLIPDLKVHFQSRLDRQQHILLVQFDTVTMDFSRHCSQIISKMMAIMDDIIQRSLSKWEVKRPIPSPCFKTITRQIIKLHENLVDILPPQQLEELFTNIEIMFRSRLKEQLIKLGITNNGSTKHGIVNSELHHCEGALSSLDNTSAFGSSLFDVWTSFSDT